MQKLLNSKLLIKSMDITKNQEKLIIVALIALYIGFMVYICNSLSEEKRKVRQLQEDIKNIKTRHEIEEENSKLSYDELLSKLR